MWYLCIGYDAPLCILYGWTCVEKTMCSNQSYNGRKSWYYYTSEKNGSKKRIRAVDFINKKRFKRL